MERIRAFTATAHVSHQYRLLQLPGIDWSLMDTAVRRWNQDIRPLPRGVEKVAFFERGKYDLAVLMFDQQCTDYALGKGALFQDLRAAVDCPVVVIVNGTPYWDERWISGYPEAWTYPKGMREKDRPEYRLGHIRGLARRLIGDATVVVNSERAREEWGFGRVIVHGIPDTDYYDLPKEIRAVSCIVPGGLDYHYGRTLFEETRLALTMDYGTPLMNIGDDWRIDHDPMLPEYGGWTAYRNFLGRSLIYFNPTRESPNPRARTEAMLSGCCVLSTPYHGADKIFNCDTRPAWKGDVVSYSQFCEAMVDEGSGIINGFVIPDDNRAAAVLIDLLSHRRYREAERIGRNGRETAKRLFAWDRYASEWNNLITEVTNG